MFTCRDVVDFLGDYLDHSLPWRQRLIFQMHLALCRDCRRYLESYRQTVAAAQSLGHPLREMAADVSISDELVQAVLAARRQYIAELEVAGSEKIADWSSDRAPGNAPHGAAAPRDAEEPTPEGGGCS